MMKAMKGKTYGFKDAKFGITRKEFEATFGQPTEALINMGEKYVTALYYRSRYDHTIISPFFKGEKVWMNRTMYLLILIIIMKCMRILV